MPVPPQNVHANNHVPPPLSQSEQAKLRAWWHQLSEDLSGPFQGKSPFDPTEAMLSNQPQWTKLTLPSGKVKETPINIAGRVSDRLDRWILLDPLAGAKLAAPITPNWENGVKPQSVGFRQKTMNTETEIEALSDLIAEYKCLGALGLEQDPNSEDPDRFVMSIFPVVKNDKGSWRLVANARAINLYIHKKHFKQEGLVEVRDTILQGDFLSTTDLSNAYLHLDGQEEW